jgi:hypothetical protein
VIGALEGRARSAPPSRLGAGRQAVALLALAVALTGLAFLAGRLRHGTGTPDAIELVSGVPVGVERSPAGALAAADDYVAVEQRTVERDPARFSALVRQAYVPVLESAALAGGRADRRGDPGGSALWAGGGESFTVIAAHRLDRYESDGAVVTVLAGQVFWGPGRGPEQVWELGQVSLAWDRGRWRVAAMRTLPAPAPAPASLPQASSRDDSTGAFDRALGGFAAVGYGTAAP